MSGSSLPTKLKVALAAQAVFALVLIFYLSQTLLRHLRFGVPQPIADYFVQLIAIVVPPSNVASFIPRMAQSAASHSRIRHCSVARLSGCHAIPGAGTRKPGSRRGSRLGWTPLDRGFYSCCARLANDCCRLLPPPCHHSSQPIRVTKRRDASWVDHLDLSCRAQLRHLSIFRK
jgi:hypothetical protein